MILLKNGTFIDWQTLEFRHTDILAENGHGATIRFPEPAGIHQHARTIACTGKFITKSFANGHHHGYSALARGMPPPKNNPENFPEILKYIWWTLDKSLDAEIIRSSALVTALACAKNGVTFVLDHHASPFAVEGCLEIIASAFDEVGVNHLLCYEISDRDGSRIAQKGLDETASYLSRRQGLVGLHASFTVGEHTLKQSMELASSLHSGIHIHAAEDQSDQEHCISHYHKRVLERLADAGVLHLPKSVLAHCLHLSDHERSLLAGSPAWVAENMESNQNNQVGCFNSKGMNRNIMLGTDGMHSDMLRSAKASFFAGQNYDTIDYPGIYRRFRNVHHYLRNNAFSGDADNNLVVLDYDTPTPMTATNFLGHFLFGIESKHVTHVISNGVLIVENRKVITVNETDILAEAKFQANRLWERMQ